MEERHTGRLVALSENDCVLLVRVNQDKTSGETIWIVPGGMVDPGETPAQAALREFTEETGLVPHNQHTLMARWSHDLAVRGRPTQTHENFFITRMPEQQPQPTGLSQSEKSDVLEYRWWPLNNLSDASVHISPPDLPKWILATLRDLSSTPDMTIA